MTTKSTHTNFRRAAALAAVAGAVLVAACSTAPRGADSRPSIGTDDPTATVESSVPHTPDGTTVESSVPHTPDGTTVEFDDATEDANDADDSSEGWQGGGGGASPHQGGGSGGNLEPVDGGPPAESGPCDEVLATGAVLHVSPRPALLESGSMSSSLTVTNCGDDGVDWTAATIPKVSLANTGGNLGPGSSSEIAFTIDGDAYEPGAVTFKIKVSEPGHNHYVDVHAFREMYWADLVPDDIGLTAGPGHGGCANQCITKAWLTPNATSPNVTLEVVTNVPAVSNVYVSESPFDLDNPAALPGAALVATSGSETTSWTTPISALAPATKYHIVVEATDEHDKTSYRAGSFTTITPVEHPGGLQDPSGPAGCAAQCITKAVVAPAGLDTNINVEVHTSAQIDVWVSQDAPQYDGNVPSFDGVDPIATSDPLDVTKFDATLSGLLADTSYHIIVRATDLSGATSYQVGTFHTAEGPQLLIRFYSIHVTHDGDSGSNNAGELSFRWGYNNELLGSRGEEKIHSGTAFVLDPGPQAWSGEGGDGPPALPPGYGTNTAFVVTDDGGFLPTLHVAGLERDPDGKIEFCSMGLGVPMDPGWHDGCDVVWNIASSGFYTSDIFDSLPRCSVYELPPESADLPCMVLETPDVGNLYPGGYPMFWVVVSFEYLP